MMRIEEMNQIRRKLGLTYQQICIESGVPIGTVQKVLGGITKNPRMETMQALEDAFGRLENGYMISRGHEETAYTGRKNETLPQTVYEHTQYGGYGAESTAKAPHVYTVDERDRLPNGSRTELIDGLLYEMEAPTPMHQDVVSEIFSQIRECIHKNASACRVYMAPTDVVIDSDAYSVVQPDVFVICDSSQITRKNIQGPPAFILEVLSPSTKRRDQILKLAKYAEAGVREYWIADPEQRQVLIFDMRENTPGGLNNGYKVGIYGFEDQIPLLISDGKCEINMEPIQQMLNEYRFLE